MWEIEKKRWMKEIPEGQSRTDYDYIDGIMAVGFIHTRISNVDKWMVGHTKEEDRKMGR